MLVLQKGLILPVPMYGGSYSFIHPPPKALEKIIIYLYSPYTRNKKEMPVIY